MNIPSGLINLDFADRPATGSQCARFGDSERVRNADGLQDQLSVTRDLFWALSACVDLPALAAYKPTMKHVLPLAKFAGLVLLIGTFHAPAQVASTGKVVDAAFGAVQGAGQVVASLRAAEPQGAVSGGWMEDFEAAKALAASQKRHMLLDFTGSDWCGWCIKLDKEVFEKPDFKAFSAQKLVLVKLDFPQRKAQDQKIKSQNASLQKNFRAEGFPTIVLLNPSGVEIKRWSGFNPNLLNELKSKIGAK